MNDFEKSLRCDIRKRKNKDEKDEGLYSRMDKSNISVSDMQQMQTNLRITKGWTDTDPVNAKDHLLYMIEEMGEVIQIIKKKGIDKCMTDPDIRSLLTEELSDVEMYYIEVLNRLQISPKEFSEAYVSKHMKNLGREYNKEWHKKLIDENNKENGGEELC